MRELDVLLNDWLDRRFESASPSQKAEFCKLLALSDPELVGYLLRGERAVDEDRQRLIEQLRGQAED